MDGSQYRRRVWQHNSLRGRTILCKSLAAAVLKAETTTEEAKAIAVRLEQEADFLLDALNTRNPNFEKERNSAKSNRTS